MTIGELIERLEALKNITDDYKVLIPSLIPEIEGAYTAIDKVEVYPEYREIHLI